MTYNSHLNIGNQTYYLNQCVLMNNTIQRNLFLKIRSIFATTFMIALCQLPYSLCTQKRWWTQTDPFVFGTMGIFSTQNCWWTKADPFVFVTTGVFSIQNCWWTKTVRLFLLERFYSLHCEPVITYHKTAVFHHTCYLHDDFVHDIVQVTGT